MQQVLASVGQLPDLPAAVVVEPFELQQVAAAQAIDQAAHLCGRGAHGFGQVALAALGRGAVGTQPEDNKLLVRQFLLVHEFRESVAPSARGRSRLQHQI